MKKLIGIILFSSLFIISGCFNTNQDSTPSPYDRLNNLDHVTLAAVEETVAPIR